MTIGSRRLALLVLAGAGLAFGVAVVMLVVAVARGGADALGYGGAFVFVTLLALVPVLLVVAAMLGIRNRLATRLETVLLVVLGGTVAFLAAAASAESVAGQMGGAGQMLALTAVVLGWIPVGAAALITLGVVIVQTIRTPARAPD